jgi:uncharacterized membrane protein YdjX (TVP38/TMEM64 family)
MKEEVLALFNAHPGLAIVISLGLSVLIAIVGILPSVFLTAANILFFGFLPGMFISFMGETLGAIVAFFLYRWGFKKNLSHRLEKFPRAQRLVEAGNREAFLLILSLRLLPFVPSGLVTFAASIGRVSALTFIIASSLGKIPALLLEGYSVLQVTRFGWEGKLILAIAALIILYLAWRQIRKSGG